MTTKTQTRASARAMVGAAAFGSLAGLGLACAYLGGAMGQASDVQARSQQMAAASGLDPAALNPPGRDIDSVRAGLRRTAFSTPGLAAPPFRMIGPMAGSRDLDCLTQAVYFEARGEGVSGMQAVAQVVLNRVRHPAFPKTVCGVVYQGVNEGACQFSFACENHPAAPMDAVWRRAHDIAAKALSGHVMSEVGGATHFHATRVSPDWRDSLMKVVQIGSHIFYRFGGGEHQGGTFRYAAQTAAPAQPILASLGVGPSEPPQPVAYTALEKTSAVTGDKPADLPPAKVDVPTSTPPTLRP